MIYDSQRFRNLPPGQAPHLAFGSGHQMGRQPRPLLEANLHQQDEALAPLGSAIYQAILQLESLTSQIIMELRYIHCLTIREIAGETGYSASGVRRIIDRALKEITKSNRS